ncbi:MULTISPECIES: cache domain-containing protein [unclassified Leclercia]|uniref:PDC sensor domain-containing protein n=1 Tax=Leclercia barmai TaxID=2785629 RepID=A0ABS7RZ04_9ENTR|nr:MULTISPECIES: cache domain-containing protein [unclassified Leclercia]MBZ0059536.1 PDC sensor domain-containing protein [Leclercia sp. EMC7]MCM5697330.1 cache domain-containing protein [Leclercia sp. LTM01]MCM5702072.1 cache domain-containing protein [Leclercia sp. LTM14]
MTLPASLTDLIDKIDDITVSTVESTATLANLIRESITHGQKASAEALLDPAVKPIIQEHIRETLKHNRYCSGAGFASHIESSPTTGEYWLLEWWFKKSNGLQQVNLDLDQATQQRLDFRTFEWFKHASSSGKAFIHGPYVDYVCNTAYTLTSAVPVFSDQQFLGVAAIDMLVGQIEEELLTCRHPDRVVLTNRENRIIFSTWPHYRVGNLLTIPPATVLYQSDYFFLYQCDN